MRVKEIKLFAAIAERVQADKDKIASQEPQE